MDTSNSFPSHNIDPRKKDRAWRLQFIKAAWYNSTTSQPASMFYSKRDDYDKIKSYALGRQKTDIYRKAVHVDEQSSTSYAVLDFKPLPAIKNHRSMALAMLQKSTYNIVATPIDALAKDQADDYYAQVKAKLLMKDALKKQGSPLAQMPQLQPEPGEPIDLEELDMQKDFGFRFNYAMEAEMGIQFIFDQNEMTECRCHILEDIFDYGVGVYKDWMEPDGKVRFRRCDPRNIITNYCRYPNFSDILWCGEVLDMPWSDFREEASGSFSEEDFENIYNKSKTQNYFDARTTYSKVNDKFKVKVLDLEWYSDDEYVYEDKVNQYGNPVYTKTDYKNKGKDNTKSKKRKVIYKGKWVVGTDFIYSDGLATYMKRDKSISNTKLSYHIVATNFHEMSASGVMGDLIPIADQMSISWLKLQNIRNALVPFAWDIDLDALEDVSLSKGGEQLNPEQLLKMFYQNGVLINRRKGIEGKGGSNYKTVEFIQTNYGALINEAWDDFNRHMQLLSTVTGFNEVTNASTIDPKTLNGATQAMQESTNNALYHIQKAEKDLMLKLAHAVLCRMRRAIKRGKIEGYVRALGTNTEKFFRVSPDFDLHDYAIMLEDKPDAEKKAMLQQMISKGMQDGTLDPTDIITVENCNNLKQAEQILAYRIKKRKEEEQEKAMQQQQQNGQIQMQSAQAAEQAKQQTLQLEYQLKKDMEMAIMDKKIQMLQMELQVKYGIHQEATASQERQTALSAGQPMPMSETPLPQAAMQPQMQGQPMEEQPQDQMQDQMQPNQQAA